MELRKNIKAPKRYEPELADSPHEVRYMPRGDSKPLFRPLFIDYNPHLPQAAFPTLNSIVPALCDTAPERLPDGKQHDGGRQAESGPSRASGLKDMSSTVHSWSFTAQLEAPDVMLLDTYDTASTHHPLSEDPQLFPDAIEENSFLKSGEMFRSAMESSDEDMFDEDDEETFALADARVSSNQIFEDLEGLIDEIGN